MNEWNPLTGQYEEEEILQGDDKDEPDAKVKIKLKGKPALELIKAIAPDLKKAAKKGKGK